LTSCSSDETLMTFDRFKAQDVFWRNINYYKVGRTWGN
jgi:hypothetical protein